MKRKTKFTEEDKRLITGVVIASGLTGLSTYLICMRWHKQVAMISVNMGLAVGAIAEKYRNDPVRTSEIIDELLKANGPKEFFRLAKEYLEK